MVAVARDDPWQQQSTLVLLQIQNIAKLKPKQNRLVAWALLLQYRQSQPHVLSDISVWLIATVQTITATRPQ